MRLPRALGRWSTQLEIFPDDVATAVGSLVQRLAPAFDGLSSSEQEPSGDVDGFDGIGSRGSYERLLASEWMLREAAPLEFLRRAAGGEHTFLQLALRRPATPESTLVLLDGGPDQLGDCRLVQLALLVLLVQRSESRKTALYWQQLHRFGEGLFKGLNESSVRGFLSGRTGARSSQSALGAWSEVARGSARWLIGSPAVTALDADAAARITLHERVASERVVDVTFAASRRSRHVALSLPEPALAARVLRDPFEQARAPRAKTEVVASDLLLSAKGSRLFHRNAAGDLLSIPIPNSPRAPLGRPRRFAAEGGLISSVGGRGRRLVWLSSNKGMVSLGYADGRKQPLAQHVAEGPELEPRALTPLLWFPGEAMAVYQGKGGVLWRTDFRTGRTLEIGSGVRAWMPFNDRHLIALERWQRGSAPGSHGVLEIKPLSEELFMPVTHAWQDAKLVGLDQSGTSLTMGWQLNGVWNLQEHVVKGGQRQIQRITSLHAPSGTHVVGIEAFAWNQPRPGLWLVETDRKALSIVNVNRSQVLFRTSATIEHVCLASAAQVAAISTSSRELVVVSADGQQLYRGAAE